MIWIELIILLGVHSHWRATWRHSARHSCGHWAGDFRLHFALPPGGPPPGVLGMIIAVITALATMQAAGGLDYLVSVAERIMRKHPQYIIFIAPVVTYCWSWAPVRRT